jgi:E-phenylitaconyl-CoA hydratase
VSSLHRAVAGFRATSKEAEPISGTDDQKAGEMNSETESGIDLAAPLEGFTYVKEGSVAIVTINRPEAANSLTTQMRPILRAIWSDSMQDAAIRVVIVTAAGVRHFSTGIALGDVAASGEVTTGDGPLREELVWSPRMMGVTKPVICAVNGLVAGGGLHFVVDSDIVVAADHAVFMDTHTSVGMVGGPESVGLAHRLSFGSAMRMTLCGRSYRMPAARAHTLGLVDEIVPGDTLMSTAREIAEQISKNSPEAVRQSKAAIWASVGQPIDDAMELDWSMARAHWTHPDFIEGPRAFAEKRDPVWVDA